MNLRNKLQSALDSRRRALRFGWNRRKDYDAMRASIMRVESFLLSFPNASDALVRNWCREHATDVARVVLGGRHALVHDLIGHG